MLRGVTVVHINNLLNDNDVYEPTVFHEEEKTLKIKADLCSCAAVHRLSTDVTGGSQTTILIGADAI